MQIDIPTVLAFQVLAALTSLLVLASIEPSDRRSSRPASLAFWIAPRDSRSWAAC
jgi:hypothetical protein